MIEKKVVEYCEDHSTQPDEELYNIYRSINLQTANPHQSSTPYQGLLLQMLAEMQKPRTAVEIGCFAGYSTICIARGLAAEGKLHAVEGEIEYRDRILGNAHKAGVEDQIVIHIGQALDVIPTLPDEIDFAFVDADKQNYINYYHQLLPKMSQGGLLIFDNTLWYGRVLNPDDRNREVQILRQLNDLIQADASVQNILLPVRDGLMICRKLSPTS